MLFEATASLACCAFKADKADPKILAEKFDTYNTVARPIPSKQGPLSLARNREGPAGWSGG
jgi:hypothetical protein